MFRQNIVKYRYRLSTYYTHFKTKLPKRTFDKEVIFKEVLAAASLNATEPKHKSIPVTRLTSFWA